MESTKEFNLIFYMLATLGLIHFLHDQRKHTCTRYVTFIYSLLRSIAALLNVINMPVSLIISQNSVTERMISLFYAVMSAINCVYLFYLCTHRRKLNAFFAHWQTVRLTSNKSTYTGLPFICFGIIFASIPIGFYIFSSFIDSDSTDRLLALHTSYLYKNNKYVFIVLKIYHFITMALLETMSFIFIPIFYLVISNIIAGEFSEWNEFLKRDCKTLTFGDDQAIIAQHIKMHDNLSTTVRLADNFLSFYLGINLMMLVFNGCFLLYITITDWDSWGFLSLFLVYQLIIIGCLIGGSSLINSKVKVMTGSRATLTTLTKSSWSNQDMPDQSPMPINAD